MRIIEPHQLRAYPAKKRKLKFTKRHGIILFAVAVVVFAAWQINNRPPQNKQQNANTSAQQHVETPKTSPKVLGTFTGEEFKNLYGTIGYPNIQEIKTAPTITGNDSADSRIISLATKRGFRPTSLPVAPIVEIEGDEPYLDSDNLLQPKAYEGWKSLKAAATKDGVPIKLLSAYRSIDYQRRLFLSRLYANGIRLEEIASGEGDEVINHILTLTAPPGFSRHHTGYTVDLACVVKGAMAEFISSPCFEWISKNNYEIAKRAGWIPSYPAGANEQGPEPEPWEYVWVGTETILR